MANDKVKQIQVGSSTYDIEPANSAGLSSSDITNALGYTPLEHLENEFDDTTHNFKGYAGLLEKRKVYTGFCGVANGSSPNNNTRANRSCYFITVKPNSWTSTWSVKYRLSVHLDDENQQYKSSASAGVVYPGKECKGTYECIITGSSGYMRAYSNFNTIQNTSYRPVYYEIIHETTEAGFNAGYGHKIGADITDAYLPVPVIDYSSGSAVANTKYSRSFEVIIIEAVNCEATLNDTLEVEADAYRSDYTKLNSTYYTTSTGNANAPGRWDLYTLASQGLYETGDSDSNATNVYIPTSFVINGTKMEINGSVVDAYLTGTTIFGLDKDGKALAISLRTPSATSRDTGIQTTRIYEKAGFDYTKGLYWLSTSASFAGGVNIDSSLYKLYAGIDFRYTDNCIASGSVNNLGMLPRKPVYFRGTLGSDGLFYIAPIEVTYNNQTYKRAWTQDIPTTEDGYVYWMVGWPYYNSSYVNSLYQLNINSDKSLMWFKDGAFRPYGGAGETYTASKGITITSGNDIQHTNNITAYTGTPSLMLLQHDAQGHITEDVKVGLSDGLKLSNSNNIIHTNAVTAQATQALYPIKIDSQGHISAYGTAVTSLPANGGNADTVDNKHASDFLGATATATDSSKLGGSLPAYFLDYTHLTNTPTIPAAQVNSDWSATTGVAQILNKPASYTPSSHTHGNITNDGKLATASKIVVTDANKKITTGSKAESDLLTGLTSTTTSSTDTIAYIDSITSTPATGSTTSILEYISASTATVMTGLVSSPTASAATGDIFYVESITGEGATGTTTSVLNSLTESTTATGNLEYVKSISNTEASASGTTVAVTGISGGSGAFTPTNKYMRVSYSAGTAVRGGTTRYMTGSFSGTKTNDLVTSVTVSSQGSVTLAGSVTTTNNRNTLVITASHSGTSLSVTKGDYTPAGSVSLGATTTSSAGPTYVQSLNSNSSVGGSVNLQIGASATTTATNWSNVGTTGTVFIESATHSHTGASASSTATVVTGVTGGTVSATTRYLARGSTNVINTVSGGGASATRKVLRKSGETATAITQITTQPLTVVTSVSGGGASAGTTKYIKGVK